MEFVCFPAVGIMFGLLIKGAAKSNNMSTTVFDRKYE